MVSKHIRDSVRIKADVIILGCTLPGIVTAHKLKKRFGDTVNIMVLDLKGPIKIMSKCNVIFQDIQPKKSKEEEEELESEIDFTAREILSNVARYYILKYAIDLKLPLPDPIMKPLEKKSRLTKIFQRDNGSTLEYCSSFHEFDFLSFLEKFELSQYQKYLDECMQDLFQTKRICFEDERNSLMYYDRTSMEKSICSALLCRNSREIMRTTVKLICGAPAHSLSLLFYLHQCYRTSSSKNHLDGENTRFREKLLGHCRKRMSVKLQQSIADITLKAHTISEIRTLPNELELITLGTTQGETTYTCSLLAMALRPEQLHDIQVDEQLITAEKIAVAKRMIPGRAKKFQIQYEDCFWQNMGYSGDIFSLRGPIIWAMEKPNMSATGSNEKYYSLLGYLMDRDHDRNSKDAVVEQLISLFGDEAADPVMYRESIVADIYVPPCGDYVALRRLISKSCKKGLEWGALDIFADGDMAAAIEAGHTAYLHLLACLRPQAQSYDDVATVGWPTLLRVMPIARWKAQVNIISGFWLAAGATACYFGVKFLSSFFKRN